MTDLDPRKDENVNVYGVVVDASVAFHQKDTNRYICQLKIIDESHHTLGNHEKQCKFINVVFHGKRMEDCPHIKQVGDVIRIHRAQVKEYAQKRQLTVNVYLGATWVLFKQNGGKECANSTDEEDNEKVGGSRYRPYLFSGKSHSFDPANDKPIIRNLQQWSFEYLHENSCMFRSGNKQLAQCHNITDRLEVDLVFKILKIIDTDEYS